MVIPNVVLILEVKLGTLNDAAINVQVKKYSHSLCGPDTRSDTRYLE